MQPILRQIKKANNACEPSGDEDAHHGKAVTGKKGKKKGGKGNKAGKK